MGYWSIIDSLQRRSPLSPNFCGHVLDHVAVNLAELILSNDPVTIWIDQLRNADEAAAQKLWNHFVIRLNELSRKKLRFETRRVYDEEDATLSAFNSVLVGIGEGRFPDLGDRESLWRLLVVIASRKMAHRKRYDRQLRRDVRRNASESFFFRSASDTASFGVDGIESPEPTAEFAAEFAETYELLFDGLGDPTLQQVVTLRMDGHTDSEIAAKLNCSRRTVQRRLEVVRRQWDELGTIS